VGSPSIASFGAWAEQLLAESTGKDGKGVIPIDGEPLGEARGVEQGALLRGHRLHGGHDPRRGKGQAAD
jgi:transaldolase/glucose-6-phosphate isomerase